VDATLNIRPITLWQVRDFMALGTPTKGVRNGEIGGVMLHIL